MIEQFISTHGYLFVSLLSFGFAYQVYKDYKTALKSGIHDFGLDGFFLSSFSFFLFAGVVCFAKWILTMV